MSGPNPELFGHHEEETGRTLNAHRRTAAVERALERMRAGAGAAWGSFTLVDLDCLRAVLGEMWDELPRERWDALRFSTLGPDGSRELILRSHALCDIARRDGGAAAALLGLAGWIEREGSAD
jgi:hypothetical protein